MQKYSIIKNIEGTIIKIFDTNLTRSVRLDLLIFIACTLNILAMVIFVKKNVVHFKLDNKFKIKLEIN